MNRLLLTAASVGTGLWLSAMASAAKPPVIPDIKGSDGVKGYLLAVIDSVISGAKDLKTDAGRYQKLIADNGGSPAAAAKAKPQEMASLILKLRDDYERIDSYGYEYMEGIVAGVPQLIKYDVELDSGVPLKKSGLTDQVAPVVIRAGDITLDREGSLNNFLIEPTVFGTNPQFVQGSAALPGFNKPVNLPRPSLVGALADYAIDAYGRLKVDATAWKPTDADCFHILFSMTPTLADYFDDWKESKKYGAAIGGRFVAVSRVSDMRGIMKSTQLAWLAMSDNVNKKDPALAGKITQGYEQILSFIDKIDVRDQKLPLKLETIDALGSQAKEKADKLTVQTGQAAALMGIDVNKK